MSMVMMTMIKMIVIMYDDSDDDEQQQLHDLLVRGDRTAVVGVDVHGSMASEDDPGGDATVHALQVAFQPAHDSDDYGVIYIVMMIVIVMVRYSDGSDDNYSDNYSDDV